MALHTDTYEMLRESLQELMFAARYCVEFDKSAGDTWGNPGCLGYPAGLLLCCAIDAIGAVYKDSTDVLVEIGGRKRPIKQADEHFYILNSKYFQQDLDDESIQRLYKGFRSLLVHNSVVARDIYLVPGKLGDSAFEWEGRNGKRTFVVSLHALLEVVSAGVETLLAEAKDRISESKVTRGLKRIPFRDIPESIKGIYSVTTGHTEVTGFVNNPEPPKDH